MGIRDDISPTFTDPNREGILNPRNSNQQVPEEQPPAKMQCRRRHVYPKQNYPATMNALKKARSPYAKVP
jgi:hypothetical protein